MKKSFSKYIAFIIFFAACITIGGNDVVDLKPINGISDADYWKTTDQFKLAANEFYTYLRNFANLSTDNQRGDFVYSREGANVWSNGSNTIPITDANWNLGYTRARVINYFLDKASTYAKPTDIKVYVAEAKFFRAYVFYDLLQQYGGVPIVDKVLTISSPELSAPRNTREETVDFIIADLEHDYRQSISYSHWG